MAVKPILTVISRVNKPVEVGRRIEKAEVVGSLW